MRRTYIALVTLILTSGLTTAEAAEKATGEISFQRTRLDGVFRSEGVAVGDFNKDGKKDIAAGSVYFTAPDWKMHSILEKPEEFDPVRYSVSFCNWAEDLNRDGWDDLIVVDFPGKQTWWFENPQTAAGPWKRHTCIDVTNNESPLYLDIDGDGKRELICGTSPDPKNFDGPERQLVIARPAADPYAKWAIQAISAKGAPGTTRYSHGLGVGDINKDGRNDIMVTQGWWESPAEKSQSEWKFHPVNFGQPCANMYAYDFDGDGDNDVLTTSAHKFGIWWHEQTTEGWKTHEIDMSFSETHSVCLVDINGDGLQDFVTGKRWWSHATREPGADMPAVMKWFELTRKDGKPVWIPHQFDHDSGVGTQFEVADVNGDGLLDVVTSNKKGSHYFQQVRQ
jgi:hypothetical protein